MRVRIWMKAFVIVPALCLAGLSTVAQQQGSSQQQTGDPVADAARKAREMKKDAPKPKKVYTDDDVKKSVPVPDAAATSAPVVASGTAAATTAQAAGDTTKARDATKAEDATKTGDSNNQAAWRKQVQDQPGKL